MKMRHFKCHILIFCQLYDKLGKDKFILGNKFSHEYVFPKLLTIKNVLNIDKF